MSKKTLAWNLIYNVLYKSMNILFPLITSMYVARVLKAESIGKVAAAQNNVSYFTLIAAMGIPTYGVKLIAQFKAKSRECSKAFCELFVINGVLSIICSLAFYAMVTFTPFFDGMKGLYYIAGLNVVFNVFNIDWFYQGVQEYKYIAARSFVIKIMAILALVLFVKSEADFYAYAFISSVAIIGNHVFNIINIRNYVIPVTEDLAFKEHLKHILVLFAASVAVEIYMLADTTMLDIMCSDSIVGYYSMSMKMIRLIRSLVAAASAVFLPQLSHYYYNGEKQKFRDLADKGVHVLCCISIPTALGLFMVADHAVTLFFGVGFLDSIVTTRILSISIVTVAFSNYVGMQILITIGKERITSISTLWGAMINIILNYILIRNYQHVGAAVASVITEALVMVIQIILSRKYILLKCGLKSIGVSSLGMCLVIVLLKQVIPDYRLSLFASIAIGAATYFSLMFMMKDSFALFIAGKAQSILKKRI